MARPDAESPFLGLAFEAEKGRGFGDSGISQLTDPERPATRILIVSSVHQKLVVDSGTNILYDSVASLPSVIPNHCIPTFGFGTAANVKCEHRRECHLRHTRERRALREGRSSPTHSLIRYPPVTWRAIEDSRRLSSRLFYSSIKSNAWVVQFFPIGYSSVRYFSECRFYTCFSFSARSVRYNDLLVRSESRE